MSKTARNQVVYVCQSCGHESPKWQGRCPSCGTWNAFVEERGEKAEKKEAGGGRLIGRFTATPTPITEIREATGQRVSTGSSELDLVLGGGIVRGSVTLVGGEPGIGKSTLLLQVAKGTAARGRVLYVSGEESGPQLRMRAARLGCLDPRIEVLNEIDASAVIETVSSALAADEPNDGARGGRSAGGRAPGGSGDAGSGSTTSLLIVDSIQTMVWPDLESAPGSVGQVRECAARLVDFAKTSGIPVFIIGHVTKEGALAGPRVLEHMVDTVLYFEGDRNVQFRVLRAVKNRFGSTNEVGLFEMGSGGLRDVPDASAFFLSERHAQIPGGVVMPAIEGTRPLLVEVQALVSASPFVPPRRTADGVDIKRVQLVLAVLEKRCGLPLGGCDVFVKVAGGMVVDEPAVDLGLAVVLASSFRDRSTGAATAVFGEVGLAGEVRAVTQAEQRVREAEKMGFRKVVVPKANLKGLAAFAGSGLEINGVETVAEALKAALGG